MMVSTSNKEIRKHLKRRRETNDRHFDHDDSGTSESEQECHDELVTWLSSDTRNYVLRVRVKDAVGVSSNLQSDLRFTSERSRLEKRNIRLSLSERYSRSVHIEHDGGGMPSRYCFYNKDDKINEADLYPVSLKFDDFSLPLFKGCNERWTKLNAEGQADLHVLLNIPVSLVRLIELTDDGSWKRRSPENVHTIFSYLKRYGVDNTENSVMNYLSKGRSTEDMEPLGHKSLLEDWDSALCFGMMNGDACTAVYGLFQEISELLPRLDITVPVGIFYIMPSAQQDVSISPTSTKILSKCQKLDEKEVDRKPEIEKGEQKITQHAGRHFVDLEVAAIDKHTGFAKYLALIKIHSKDETMKQTEKKFLTEVISVLQSQNAVFGFLFASDLVVAYHAKRKTSGKIIIYKFEYPLSERIIPSGTLNVAFFQLLIMDILSCFIYGIEKIRV